MNVIEKINSFLEDKRYPSVGPHLRLLSFTGLWHPDLKSPKYRFKQIIFLVTVTFFLSQYVKCIIKFNTDDLKLILQYAPFHMGIIKACLFQKDYKIWEELIDFMSSMELSQISKKDENLDKLMKTYIRNNRRVSYFFWALAFFSNFSIFTEPYQKNNVNLNGTSTYLYIFDGYTPFDGKPPGYYFSMCIQTILGHIVSTYVVGWDTLVVSIMIFFAGQLRISKLYCARMITTNSEKSHKNIAECHRFHISLIKYQKVFNRLISSVMYVYLIVISVNLGVCIKQIAEIEDDLPTLVSSCVFLIACLIQLLLFYWHSNEVTNESSLVAYSTFQSKWTQSNRRIQKEVALLSLTTGKKMVFKAGPFNEMSIATFISILRASYSFYTLLKGTN